MTYANLAYIRVCISCLTTTVAPTNDELDLYIPCLYPNVYQLFLCSATTVPYANLAYIPLCINRPTTTVAPTNETKNGTSVELTSPEAVQE